MKMLSNTEHTLDANTKRCPLCNSSLNRIPRRFIDLAFSLFTPLQRYRCRSFRCDWEGNLYVK